MAEPAEAFADAKRVTIPVNPARLAWGTYDHERGRLQDEIDVATLLAGGSNPRSGRLRGSLGLHGSYYEIHTGRVEAYNHETGKFEDCPAF